MVNLYKSFEEVCERITNYDLINHNPSVFMSHEKYSRKTMGKMKIDQSVETMKDLAAKNSFMSQHPPRRAYSQGERPRRKHKRDDKGEDDDDNNDDAQKNSGGGAKDDDDNQENTPGFSQQSSGPQSQSGAGEFLFVILSYLITLAFFPLSLYFIFMIVLQFERIIIFRNGKITTKQGLGPGLVHFLPCVDEIKHLDLRTKSYNVPPQDILTQDSLTVMVDAVIFYRIVNPMWAVMNVADHQMSVEHLAASTVRNAIGARKLAEVLRNRPAASEEVYTQIKKLTKVWGVHIIRAEIKEIRLPLQLQKAMAAEAESTRIANAKIIEAKAEIEATRNLQTATTILMENPMSMQLRYLQSLQLISGDKSHTVVMPFSVDIIKSMFP